MNETCELCFSYAAAPGNQDCECVAIPWGSLRPEHAHQLIPIVADRGVSSFLRSPGSSARTPVLRSSSLLGGGRLDRLVGISREKAVGVHVLASSHAGFAAPPPLLPGRSQLPSESRCERLE